MRFSRGWLNLDLQEQDTSLSLVFRDFRVSPVRFFLRDWWNGSTRLSNPPVMWQDLMLKTQRIQIPPCVGSKREDCVFCCSRKETGRIIFYVFFCCCKLELFLIFFFSVQESSFQIHFYLFVLIWDRLKGWTEPLIRAVRLKIQTLMISLHQIQYDIKLWKKMLSSHRHWFSHRQYEQQINYLCVGIFNSLRLKFSNEY